MAAPDRGAGAEFERDEDLAALDLEVIDPVSRASPLPPTLEGRLPPGESEAVQEQAQRFPIAAAAWWQQFRGDY